MLLPKHIQFVEHLFCSVTLRYRVHQNLKTQIEFLHAFVYIYCIDLVFSSRATFVLIENMQADFYCINRQCLTGFSMRVLRSFLFP